MASLFLLLLLLLHSSSSTSSGLDQNPADRVKEVTTPTQQDVPQRKLLQTSGAAVPPPPLTVFSADMRPCILFRTRRLTLRHERQQTLDLTEQIHSAHTHLSVCQRLNATLVLSFGDVEGLRALTLRLQLSNTFWAWSAHWWFSVEGVSLRFDGSEEFGFEASEVWAPASSSFRCRHVSSLRRHRALLTPSSPRARQWTLTFTDFQIQAFNLSSQRFSPSRACAAALSPALLMGLLSSLILLLVLAYALHMLVHLRHMERQDKAQVNCPLGPALPAAAELPGEHGGGELPVVESDLNM